MFNDFPMISAKQVIDISIRHDGLVIWINVDGKCITRIMTNGMIHITIEDKRKNK